MAAVYPRYAQATTPLDHWQQRAQPVLVADQPWERGAVQEPTVLYDAARHLYRMWYTGGWVPAAIGYAQSTDGVHWQKHHGPVLGIGAGGFAGSVAHSSVTYAGGRYYLYFAADPGDGALHLATSADGVHFRTRLGAVLAPVVGQPRLANTDVWQDERGWHMLYEAWTPAGLWQMGLARGTDAAHWQRVAGGFPLRSLQIGQGCYGGPAHQRVGALYHLWYHAARQGVLPTDLYHATSIDLVHWHVLSANPVLARALSWEVDQTADASVLLAGTAPARLYFDGMDNPAQRGRIGLATPGV